MNFVIPLEAEESNNIVGEKDPGGVYQQLSWIGFPRPPLKNTTYLYSIS